MRNYRRLYWLMAALTACSLLCLRPIAARADEEEFTVIKLLVNVLNGVPITIQEIEDTIKEANKILKQAKIRLEWDKANHHQPGFPDGGNNNSMVDPGEFDPLITTGLVELARKRDAFGGRGKGYKIYYTNGINHPSFPGATLGGLSWHDPGRRVIFLNPFPISGAAARGNDLAHEVCHINTLGRFHVVVGSTNTLADATCHINDPNNLMYHFNDGVTVKRGTQLTPLQIDEIRKNAKNHGSTVLLDPATASVAPLNTLHGSWESPQDFAIPAHFDFIGGNFFAQEPDNMLVSTIRLRGMFPDTTVGGQFTLYFDTDNNPLTGFTSSPLVGIDRHVQVTFSGSFPFETNSVILVDTIHGGTAPLPPAMFGRVELIGDVPAPPAFNAPDEYDKIEICIPLSHPLLGPLADEVQVGVSSFSFFGGGDKIDGMFPLTIRQSPGARIMLNTNSTIPGGAVGVLGTGFTPMSSFNLLLDDTSVGGGVVGPDGSLSAIFTVPNGTLPDDYFVTVRDASGLSDFSIVDVLESDLSLRRLALKPSRVVGGEVVMGTVYLSKEAPADVTVWLNKEETLTAATVPPSVIVPKGAKSAVFTIQTKSVKFEQKGEITATFLDKIRSKVLTILRPRVLRL